VATSVCLIFMTAVCVRFLKNDDATADFCNRKRPKFLKVETVTTLI